MKIHQGRFLIMEKKVLVETSARHIHLTEDAVKALYGENAELIVKKELSQPGQFACANDKITLVGPKGTLAVSVLGPTRKSNQVELSFTDARTLGLKAVPVRESGDTAGTPGLKMVGPAGEVEINEGVIIAKRHIHMTPEDAKVFGVEDKQVVKVKVANEARTTIFDDVVCRVNPSFALAMHIDTDECNAAAAFGEVYGEVIL